MSASGIISKLPSSFDHALSSADLIYFPSVVHTHTENGVEYSIRLCPSLAKKPPLPTSSEPGSSVVKNLDPFSPPYNPNLYIGSLRDDETGEEYIALLNKFSIVPHHFVLATKEFELQSSPLYPPDLLQTYQLILAAHKGGRHFIAFYNCGNNSGASQPHKHLQFIPIEDEDGPPIERLTRSARLETPDKPFSLPSLPYSHHIIRIPSPPPPHLSEFLSQAFLSLLDLTFSSIRHDPDYPAGKPSYNVLITREHMHIIPRRLESPPVNVVRSSVVDVTDGMVGTAAEAKPRPLSVNALAFAGMLVAKSEEELEALKTVGVGTILRSVGVANVHDLQVGGTAMEAMGDL